MFPSQNLEEIIKKIKQGDYSAREDFLESCRPFVFKAACKFSKQILEWGRDEELSVALIAFNEAIDRYSIESGVPFQAFARIVMNSRLTDYRRRENRNAMSRVPLQRPGGGLHDMEISKAWEVYWDETVASEREDEIKEFEKLLKVYGVSFDDLVKYSPKHHDTRQSLTAAAQVLAEDSKLWDEFTEKKKLPLLELQKGTQISRKTLERGRKFIIALALLINKREDFIYLSSYVKLPAPGKRGI